MHDKSVTRITFRDNLATPSSAKALNNLTMLTKPVPLPPKPPQIHRVNNIYIITFSKNVLKKESL